MEVISFVNMKGGVGKTTLAVNVADALNRRHDKRVLLVDIDPQFNATQCLYSGDKYVEIRKAGGHTIADLINDTPGATISPVDGVQSTVGVKLEDVEPWVFRDGFHLLAGNLEIYRLDMGAGQGREMRLKRYLEHVEKQDLYDIVIIDTPPTPSTFMNSALLASSHYVVPVRPEPLSRVGIDLLRGVINRVAENYGHQLNCAGVVITMADARTNVLIEALDFLKNDNYWKDKRINQVFPARTAIAQGQGRQELILDGKNGDAKLAITGIANQLLLRL